MHPVLFKIPFIGITVYSYGVFVALAFLVAMFWVTREARIRGLDRSKIADLMFYVILSSIIGSRIMHVLVSQREDFFRNPLMIVRFWEGGLAYYGGLITAILVSVWFIRRHKLPFYPVADCFSPAISIGHALGRVGCFFAGCCFGKQAPVGSWFAVIFPQNQKSFAPAGMELYPTQLMEALGELLIFCILLLVRRSQKFSGQIFATYLMLYAILRSAVEVFRGDIIRGFVIEPWISTSQFISIFMFAIGVAIYVVGFRRLRREAK